MNSKPEKRGEKETGIQRRGMKGDRETEQGDRENGKQLNRKQRNKRKEKSGR